jgi:hypothetical protein
MLFAGQRILRQRRSGLWLLLELSVMYALCREVQQVGFRSSTLPLYSSCISLIEFRPLVCLTAPYFSLYIIPVERPRRITAE